MRANNAPVGSESGKYFREAVEFNMPFGVECVAGVALDGSALGCESAG